MKFLILSLLTLTLSAAHASSVKLHVDLSPTGSFEAQSQEVNGEAQKTKEGGVFAKKISVLIQTLKTDIDLRDEHLWKHLNSTRHPKAVITDVSGKDGKASGTLELAGVKRPVSIAYEEKGDSLIARLQVKNSDFKLPAQNYMGVGVEDLVSAEATIPLRQMK